MSTCCNAPGIPELGWERNFEAEEIVRPFRPLALALLLATGCATVTPAEHLRNDVFWDAAHECDHFGTLNVVGIDVDGTVSLRANAESRAELRLFLECLRQAVRSRVERRRQAGEPVPPELLIEPTAEID